MATILFDLDDTLIDSAKIKKAIFDTISAYGLDQELVEKSYHEAKSPLGNYTIENHVDFLSKQYGFPFSREVVTWFEHLDLSPFLFPETISVLNNISKNNELVLLTKGEESFQYLKINNSGLKEYFSDIFIVLETKENFLKTFALSDDVYFINDKQSENKKIQEQFPHFKIINSITKIKEAAIY